MSSVKHTTYKTVGYRVISWGSTTVLAWIILGSSSSVGGSVFVFSVVDMIANTALYYLYERAWVNWPKFALKLKGRRSWQRKSARNW